MCCTRCLIRGGEQGCKALAHNPPSQFNCAKVATASLSFARSSGLDNRWSPPGSISTSAFASTSPSMLAVPHGTTSSSSPCNTRTGQCSVARRCRPRSSSSRNRAFASSTRVFRSVMDPDGTYADWILMNCSSCVGALLQCAHRTEASTAGATKTRPDTSSGWSKATCKAIQAPKELPTRMSFPSGSGEASCVRGPGLPGEREAAETTASTASIHSCRLDTPSTLPLELRSPSPCPW